MMVVSAATINTNEEPEGRRRNFICPAVSCHCSLRFLSRVSILTADIDIENLSVRLSVRLSVCLSVCPLRSGII